MKVEHRKGGGVPGRENSMYKGPERAGLLKDGEQVKEANPCHSSRNSSRESVPWLASDVATGSS